MDYPAPRCPHSLSGLHIPIHNDRRHCSRCGAVLSAADTKAEAIARVARNANPEFMREALGAVYDVCVGVHEFTADDVWLVLRSGTHDNRALGPVMLQAQREGWCQPTHRTRATRRATNNARPLEIWRSQIYGRG